MRKNLLDLSGKIDPVLVDVFDAIAGVAAARHIRYFVVGATARDMILHHGYGVRIRRATVDIDLGVEVVDWEEFHTLKEGLIASGQFEPTRAAQRLVYRQSLPVDIVPFGPLERDDGEISWPPDHSVRMNVQGFEDAYQDAHMVRLRSEPVLDIPFASLAGLAILKIIAWNDRFPQGRKDAGDLVFLMSNYLDAGNQERLAEEYPELLEGDDFDYERAGVRLLGLDMGKVMSPRTREVILGILDRETGDPQRYRLVEDMMGHFSGGGDAFEESLLFLNLLRSGIRGG
jgi:predicted nucleotidyltransferase